VAVNGSQRNENAGPAADDAHARFDRDDLLSSRRWLSHFLEQRLNPVVVLIKQAEVQLITLLFTFPAITLGELCRIGNMMSPREHPSRQS
jgi:hypothetical protein